jgi:hypothetical protein
VISVTFIFGQVPSTLYKYELKRKSHSWTPDSTRIIDSTQLFSFNEIELNYDTKLATIIAEGYEQNYILSLKIAPDSSIGILTSYTYAINKVPITKADKEYFTTMKIKNKVEWKLQTKQSTLPTELTSAIADIINRTNIDNLPSEKSLYNTIGIQVDGAIYIIKISDSKQVKEYKIGDLYLENAEELAVLKPLEELIELQIVNNIDYRLEYKSDGTIYNSGSSASFFFKKN